MTAPHLSVVPDQPSETTADEGLSQRVQRLQSETRQATHVHIAQLTSALETVAALADEIAVGGDAYPQIVRDTARRLSQESPVALRVLRGTLDRR